MAIYLITGIAGFIGSSIAKALEKQGHELIGIDNLLTGKRSNIPLSATFIEGDIADQTLFESLRGKKIDAILHLAAQSSGEISFEKPQYDVLTNTLGTLNLLNFAVEEGISRFIYASTMSIYGDVDDKPIREDQAKNPKSYYGITKLAAEQYVRVFSDRLDTTSFRLFNVYGPGQNMDNLKQGMVSIYLAYFMRNEPLIVKGAKERYRDLTYIDDVVDVWTASIDNPRTYGKTYNLATGQKTTVETLLNELKSAWGSPEYPIYFTEGTPGDQFGIYADITHLQNDLEWEPKVSLAEGIQHFVAWVKGKMHADM
jgi:UDP-glucose 4-epimerase